MLDILVGAGLGFIPSKRKPGRILTRIITCVVLVVAVITAIKNTAF